MDAARTLLLTRPRAQSEAFAAALDARLPGRFRPVVAPLLAIRPLPGPLDLAGVQGLVFTSANGVEQFAARTAERRLPAFCVGDMTAAAAVRAGFTATSAGGDVAALAALLVAANRQGAGAVSARPRQARGGRSRRPAGGGRGPRAGGGDLRPGARAAAGRSPARLAAGRIAVVAVFSPRTARLFAAEAAAAGWDLAPATAVALSAAADAALAGAGFGRRIVAREPARDGMLAALAGL